jgi:stage III sporulation protein AE
MKFLLVLALLVGLAVPVHATELTAPPVSGEAETLMPEEMPSFGEGLWYILKTAIKTLRPDLAQSCRLCLSVIGIAMLVSVLNGFSSKTEDVANMAGVLAIAGLLLGTANTLIHTASDTVQEISNYGKLLLPVMTAAVASQGGTVSSAALYTGTAFFDTLLGTVISALLVPMVYLFVALVIGHCAIGENVLKQLRDFLKWLISWSMKTILYVFTGYMSISSVISGGADKTALRAAKLTISGAVPVVGSIMSDASETILLGAGVVKNAAGIYGVLAVIAILILPFLRVGILYLLLKGTAAICGIFSADKIHALAQGFSDAMGFLLGMTGTVALLFLISIVCFLKGVSG